MRSIAQLAFVAALCGVSQKGAADVFTIDFAPTSLEEWASWNTVPATSDPGYLSTRYTESHGVTFRGLFQSFQYGARLLRVPVGGVPWTAHSGLSMVGWSSDQTGGPSGNAMLPQYIDFTVPQTQVSMWLMNGTGFGPLPAPRGGGPGAPQGSSVSLMLTAFDASNQVVATTPITLPGDALWHEFSVTSPGISRVLLTADNGNIPYLVWMDDLGFTAIPGPGGAGLLAAGFAVAGRRYRR
ncbi:MAG TPA: hypothetical protein VFF65_01065 [Phycisphaerales bacterium]|nr:hypothetical protein [Phycisphaerales bacterium]